MKAKLFRRSIGILFALVLIGLTGVIMAIAGGPPPHSEAEVYWSWDFESGNTSNPVGTSELKRTPNGINAKYSTGALTSGNAVTLWFIVFNYPENCAGGAFMCSPADLGDTPAQGDFLVAAGHVVGGGHFAGHLSVGDTSGSGLAEVLGCQDCTPGLVNPEGALVLLAIHDHGPAQTGQTLAAQISTFLGGCEGPFNGNEFGFATGPGDLPDQAGECSTTQFSAHAP